MTTYEKAHNFFEHKNKREKIEYVMGFLKINLKEEELHALEEIMKDI